MTKALVLHSGGLDSTTLLARAIDENDDVSTISFRYGQKHSKEVDVAGEIALYWDVRHSIIDIPKELLEGFGSTLIDDLPQPELSYGELAASEGPSPTYVPNRNAILLSLATAKALVEGIDYVYFGAHADDAHNWAYPDCTPEFIGAMACAIFVGTYQSVRLRAPYQFFHKSEIVTEGVTLHVPFGLTWSCYVGGLYHCGQCPTCISRIEAFLQAGVTDPTVYQSLRPEYENKNLHLAISSR